MTFQNNFNEPKDRYFADEDLNFQAGDSPVVLDIAGVLGIPSIDGKILVKSNIAGVNGNILVELSTDGVNYGAQFTVFNLETFPLFGYKVKKIRITHSGSDSGYRVVAR